MLFKKPFSTMWIYPWDLIDEGPERVLNRLKDEVGLDAVSLASAYHSFEMLRPHLEKQVLLQIPRAAVYFRPQSDLYKNTRIHPPVSTGMGKSDWYAEAAQAAQRTGLDLIAWTVFLHTSTLAGQYPDCAELSCTGDASTHHLCPANPEVREYAAALAKDLVQNYGISALECESLNYGGFGHTHYHVKHGVDLGEAGRFLFSLCFCPSCRAAAGADNIDSEALAAFCLAKIQKALGSGCPVSPSIQCLLDEVPDLLPFVRLRERIVSTLFDAVRAAAGVPTSAILMGSPHIVGVDRKKLASTADWAEILSYSSDPGRTGEAVKALLPDLPGPDRLMVGLQAYPPASTKAEVLCAHLRAAKDQGVHRFSFYNYGIMPLPHLAWVKQAILAAH